MPRTPGYRPQTPRPRCCAVVGDPRHGHKRQCLNSAPLGAEFCRIHQQARDVSSIERVFIEVDIFPPRRNSAGKAQPIFIAKAFPSRGAAIHFINRSMAKIERICRRGEKVNCLSIRPS